MPKPSAARRATAWPMRPKAQDAQRLAMHVPAEQVFADVACPAPVAHVIGQLDQAPRIAMISANTVSAVVSVRTPGVWQSVMPRCCRCREIVVVDADRNARNDLQPRRRASSAASISEARAYHSLRCRQGGMEGGGLFRPARIGDGHLMRLPQPRQLIGRQFAKHQDLLAVS